MKYIYIILNFGILVACGIAIFSLNMNKKLYQDIQIINIDSCQYIKFYNANGWSITHKGNCTNQIHKLHVTMTW